MIVTHVITHFGWSGGAENQLSMNLRHFADPAIEHRLIVIHTADDQVDDFPGLRKQFLFPDLEPRSRPSIVRALAQVLERDGTDLLHCSLSEAALASRVVGRSRGIPVIESLVNISHERIRAVDSKRVKPWKLAMHRWLDGLTMRTVTHFHAISDTVADSWVQTVGLSRDRISVIPRGIDLAKFDPSIRPGLRAEGRRQLGLRSDAKVILHSGRQEPQKGQVYLIRALAEITHSMPNTVLLLAGRRGNATPLLEDAIVRLGLEGRVRMLGVQRDIPMLLAASDVFAFPSLYEGLGVSLLEAMASGMPCVVTSIGPFTEFVEDGVSGLMCRTQDPSDLARALGSVLSDPGLAADLGGNARKVAEDSFDIRRTAPALEAVYRTVAESAESLDLAKGES